MSAESRRYEAIALLAREVLCEQVYRARELWDADHPCRALGLRTIEPWEIVWHAEIGILQLDSKALKARASTVLDAILAARKPARCCATSHVPIDTACPTYETGANGRCVYCDHESKCHPGTNVRGPLGKKRDGTT